MRICGVFASVGAKPRFLRGEHVNESRPYSSYIMTVDEYSKRPFFPRSLLMAALLLLVFSGCSAIKPPQTRVRATDLHGLPPWRDTTGEPDVYPIGDAVDVYRAVLDLLFVDGDESPSIIVMLDTAETPSNGGPCPAVVCDPVWQHKSKIDMATMLGYSRFSPKRPRIIPFAYRIPIVFLSSGDEARMRTEGLARLEQSHQYRGIPSQELVSEYERKYPGAWGRLRLTRVGFNPAHSEALVQASFMCGLFCDSDEIIFLKKIDTHWTVVERIPNSSEGSDPSGKMRYRGPAGRIPAESEILVSSAGDPNAAARTEGIDRATVYRTVLDSLYNFHGESPRRIVLTDWFQMEERDALTFPAHRQQIGLSTLGRYAAMGVVRFPLFARLDYRLPVSILPRDSIPALERLGLPLQKEVEDSGEYSEASPVWLAFRQHYPGAWGMVGFSGVAFNQQHTQALVFTDHECGGSCHNADTWLLNRSGEKWHIAERIPRAKDSNWALDSLRYLGVDTDPKAYRRRRVQGVFVNAATGRALPGLKAFATSGYKSQTLITDSAGRYAVENLPIMGPTILTVPCQGPKPSRQLMVARIPSRPGLDSTLSVGVDFRHCLLLKHVHALIAGAKTSPKALSLPYPNAEVTAVYAGVLDTLYPTRGSRKGPILLQPLTHRFCDFCVDDQLPRLIRQGVVDSSIENSIAKLPRDSVWLRPTFDYKLPVIVLSRDEQKFLVQQVNDLGGYEKNVDESLTGLAKEAYPGADAILSFSRVVFDDAHTRALVQVSSAGSPDYEGETMALHKFGSGWGVVRRHAERGETSGERVGVRCKPTDVPTSRPTIGEVERLIGDADITVNPTSSQLRKYAGTSRYRFVPVDTLRSFYSLPPAGDKRDVFRMKNGQRLAMVQVLDDSTRKPRKERIGSLDFFAGGSARLTFVDSRRNVYSTEQFQILRVSGREFFGSWFTVGGEAAPWKGYFCGRLR
jgi:hypothetical protein